MNSFTKSEMLDLVQGCGFTIIQCEKVIFQLINYRFMVILTVPLYK
jgi:hypothetical protein